MDDRQAEREQRVTPLELFFDLVVVFAITQVTSFLSHSPTWSGLLQGLLLLGALWWAWAAYAWLTNTLDPEEGVVRLAVLAAIAAMLLVSLAAPGAFGPNGVIFGVAYFVVRTFHLVLYAIAGRGDRDLFRAVVRIVPAATLGPALLVVAGFLNGSGQLAFWGAALAIDYLGVLVGQMRGWRVSPEHFVERFGLIVIIALGESIVAIGVGAAGLPLDGGVIAAALLGIIVAACLWWSYFDWVVFVAQARLAEATGAPRAAVATVLLLGLLPIARQVPALTALGLVAAVCASLIAYEALRHREARAWIRSRRGAFTMEEASRVERSRRRDRRPRAGRPT